MGEAILLIEDDDGARGFATVILNCFDYRVIEAENRDSSMEIFLEHANEIDLILSDIIMRHKSGRETLSEIRLLLLMPFSLKCVRFRMDPEDSFSRGSRIEP